MHHSYGRRTILTAALATAVTGCSHNKEQAPETSASLPQKTEQSLAPSPSQSDFAYSANPVKQPQTWPGVATALPGEGNFIAWTVDDGANAEVIRAYAEFMRRTGARITFFVNGKYAPNFEAHLELLKPLVKSGQLQIGNHTYSHAALTSLTDAQIQEELQSNDDWIKSTFGMSSKPYFRAPYGYYDQRVLAAAAQIGFTRPVQWYGSFADSSNIPGSEIVKLAEQYVQPQSIVIGHLNYLGITEVFEDVYRILKDRSLQTVTMNDYFI